MHHMQLSSYQFWISVEVIDTCKNEAGIQCYPHVNNKVLIDQHITNCTPWENQDNVRFQCFHFSLNFGKTLVILGGLISLFLRVSRHGPKILSCIVEIIVKRKQDTAAGAFAVVTMVLRTVTVSKSTAYSTENL